MRVLATSAALLVVASLAAPTGGFMPSAEARVLNSARRAAAEAAKRNAARAAARRQAFSQVATKTPDVTVRTWTSALCKRSRPCPLPPQYANSFVGGTYREVRLGKDTRLYRVYSSPARRLGTPGEPHSYWTRSEARGTRAVIDSALPTSRNGNTARYRISIVVPRGTVIYEGIAAPLPRGAVGGGSQVVIKHVSRDWVRR
jgi:hypothetical protein